MTLPLLSIQETLYLYKNVASRIGVITFFRTCFGSSALCVIREKTKLLSERGPGEMLLVYCHIFYAKICAYVPDQSRK
jgi:hypothetical protein